MTGLDAMILKGEESALKRLYEEKIGKQLTGFIRITENCPPDEALQLVNSVREFAFCRIKKACEDSKGELLGYKKRNESLEDFYEWTKTCYFDHRINTLAKHLQDDKSTDTREKLHVVYNKFWELHYEEIKYNKEVVHETYITVWSKLLNSPDYDPKKAPFIAWVIGIAGGIAGRPEPHPHVSIEGEQEDEQRKIFNPAIDSLVKLEAYLILLGLIYKHVQYPHHQFTFLFSMVILGKIREEDKKDENGKKIVKRWGTVERGEVVEIEKEVKLYRIQANHVETIKKYGSVLFNGPSGRCKDSLLRTYEIKVPQWAKITSITFDEEHSRCLEPLREKLCKLVSELVREQDQEGLERILNMQTALTCLNDYLEKYKTDADKRGIMAKWCERVKQRVKEVLKGRDLV